MLTEVAVRDAVADTLRAVLGLSEGGPIDERLKPVGDMGLTSPDGLDFVCELERRLGVAIPANVNPFVDDARHRARSIRQIFDWVVGQLPAWPEASYG